MLEFDQTPNIMNFELLKLSYFVDFANFSKRSEITKGGNDVINDYNLIIFKAFLTSQMKSDCLDLFNYKLKGNSLKHLKV